MGIIMVKITIPVCLAVSQACQNTVKVTLHALIEKNACKAEIQKPPIPEAYKDAIKDITPFYYDFSTGPISLAVPPGRGAAKISLATMKGILAFAALTAGLAEPMVKSDPGVVNNGSP